MCFLFLLWSPSIDLHYLRGFAGRAEPWSSFSELETAFALSGHQNNIASKNQNRPALLVTDPSHDADETNMFVCFVNLINCLDFCTSFLYIFLVSLWRWNSNVWNVLHHNHLIQVFKSLPLPQAYKTQQLVLQIAATNIWRNGSLSGQWTSAWYQDRIPPGQ